MSPSDSIIQPSPHNLWTKSWRIGRPGEVLLAWGVVLLLIATLLLQQVMIGLLGFIIAPVALGFLLVAVIRAQNGSSDSSRQGVGLILSLAGIVALVWVAFGAADLGARPALQAQRVQQGRPLLNPSAGSANAIQSIGALLAPVLIGFGLRFWASWSSLRCLVWSGIVVVVVPTILLYFKVMGLRLALSA